MTIKAKLNYLNISPRKVRLVTSLIKGMPAKQAESQLATLKKKASQPLLKLLRSALANADHNFDIEDNTKLYIKNVQVNQGPTLKRWRPRAFGRAYIVRKRTSHVILELDVKEGKVKKKQLAPTAKPSVKQKDPSKGKSKDIKKKSFFKKSKDQSKSDKSKAQKGSFFQRKAV